MIRTAILAIVTLIGCFVGASAQTEEETKRYITQMVESYGGLPLYTCYHDDGVIWRKFSVKTSISFNQDVMTIKDAVEERRYDLGQYDKTEYDTRSEKIKLSDLGQIEFKRWPTCDGRNNYTLYMYKGTSSSISAVIHFPSSNRTQAEKVGKAIIHLAKMYGADIEDGTLNEDLF